MTHVGSKALSGVTVIDLTRVLAGPFCSMILADHGARVIKVEHPDGGDDARQYGPFRNGRSGYFASINRGKESIALDLKDPADRVTFEALLSEADVLTENFRPGTMERLGYDWPALHARHPRLIYGSISGFGATEGPHRDRPAYDMIIQAMSGIMSVTGQPGGPPTRTGVSIGDLAAGLFLTIGVNLALLRRAQTGVGDRVDIAMLDCLLALLEYPITRYHITGETPSPVGTYRPAIAQPFGALQASDGRLVVAAGNDKLFRCFCHALGVPGMAEDPRFAGAEGRKDNEAALIREIERILSRRTVAQWCTVLNESGVPAAAINTVDAMLDDPHVDARRMLIPVVGSEPNDVVVGTPIKFDGVPDLRQVRQAPTLDQDRHAIVGEIHSRFAGADQ